MKKRIKYTEDHLTYLEYYYKSMNVRDLTKAFNAHFNQERTEEAIKTKLIKCGISCGREPKDRLINRIRLFTEPQKLFIRENYKGRSISEMTQLFNEYFKTQLTENQIRSFCDRNKGVVSGLTGHFRKGNKPWNADTKGLTGANKNSFQKGNIPATIKPLGSERIGKDDYILTKVLDRNGKKRSRYKPKHVHIWEQEYGPVPKGFVVAFKDSDKRNFNLENLILISRAEMLFLNIYNYSERCLQIRNNLLALAKLKAKIAECRYTQRQV